VRGLMQAAETAREELGDTDHAGKGQRPAGLVKDVEPRVKPGA
jgi:hypothetical protein